MMPRRMLHCAYQLTGRINYSLEMISLATLEELLEHQHSLGLYCPNCDRWRDADLESLVQHGFGDRAVARTRFVCRGCNGPAEKQIRPPTALTGGAVPYIQTDSQCGQGSNPGT